LGAHRPLAKSEQRPTRAAIAAGEQVLKRTRYPMARRKPTARAEFILFDVFYEDGTRSSNRKVPGFELDGLEGDVPAKGILEAQDLKIAQQSGRDRGPIKSVARSDSN
jgi:hypothetical protein